MKVYVSNREWFRPLCNFLRVYLADGFEMVKVIEEADLLIVDQEKSLAFSFAYNDKVYSKIIAEEEINKVYLDRPLEKRLSIQNRLIKQGIFDLFLDAKNTALPWGILTGIRPSKVVVKLMEEGYLADEISEILKKEYRIREDKTDLLLQVVQKEKMVIRERSEEDLHVYIGIPFCPSKCLYCSFTSYPINKWEDKVDAYLESLVYELKEVMRLVEKCYTVKTIYIGGGTPTSLNARQLQVLMDMIIQYIDLSNVKEFTVEAGRPDTISVEKLSILKDSGVDRISINPQTMNQKTLDLIGRKHTVDDIIDKYNMAKKVGFKTINMDLIIGLNGENEEDVEETMKQIARLDPENITVHTLAIKRASSLKEHLHEYQLTEGKMVENMLNQCYLSMKTMEAKPYYLYRQKDILGNFENVGFSKEGHECIYNIEMIEEQRTILSFGAGGVTKLIDRKTGKPKRVENVKSVNDYISRVSEMIERKIIALGKLEEIDKRV